MFPCGDISLDGILDIPEGEGPFPAVVVCHPHPLFGGSMDNNVVCAVCAAIGKRSIAWLRFNFRGVGRSGGQFDNGIGEQDDVKSALTFLSTRGEINSHKLGLCGYSFGTMVAIPVADIDKRVQAIAAISPFFTSPELLKNYTKPKLLLCGTNDRFVSFNDIEQIIEGLPEPKCYELVNGADHFWWGCEQEAGTKVGDFFASVLSC